MPHVRRIDRVLLWTVVGGMAWLLVYSGLTAASQGSDSLRRFVDNVVYLVPVVLATVLSYGAATHSRNRESACTVGIDMPLQHKTSAGTVDY